jgi:hypothetical protein
MATADEEVLEVGDDVPEEGHAALEKKYRQQMRQIISQKIELPISTLPEMIKEQINLSPDFQRRGRWDQEQQSRFIESIIMNVPIPPVFLGEDEYGTYAVLDGRQRLTAVNEFLRNGYKLKGLEVWDELNDLTFNDLQKRRLDRFLTRRFVPAIVELKESSPQVKYDVFDRLNTGGVIAEPMEIRNTVFQGKFARALVTLSNHHTFRQLWGIPTDDLEREKNQIYRKMDDLELVLRFFALSEPDKMNMNFKDYLGEFMGQKNDEYDANQQAEEEDSRRFMWAVTNCHRIFGVDAFRKPGDGQRPSNRSAPLADALMVALSNADPAAIADPVAGQIKDGISVLVTQDAEFRKAITAGTNGKGAITVRVTKARAVVASALV